MNAVQKNINVLIEQSGLNQTGFARSIGKTPGAVSQWLNDESKPPSMKAIVAICESYGLQPSDILSGQDGLYARAMRGSKLYPAYSNIPTASNGYSRRKGDVDGNILIYAPPDVIERHRDSFFITCEDNGMSKLFPSGCDLLVDPSYSYESGSIVVIEKDGMKLPRRMYRGASVSMFSPESWEDSYEDIIGDVSILGAVVWFQASREL